MLTPSQIRDRLARGAAAAVEGDRPVLDETASWLTAVTARELVRIDQEARRFSFEGPALGKSQAWTSEVLASPSPVVAVLAGMHTDGHVRERAVRSLVTSFDALSDRALAVRVGDHVGVVRELALREVLRRRTLDNAAHVVPVLRRFEQRGRGSGALARYLHALVGEHGEADVWARLRSSADHDLRRAAFRHSFDSGLLGLPDAVALLAGERDQVVRRRLIGVVADSATPDVIAGVLLRDRAAESRTLALVKLTAEQLDPAEVERLLVDSSVLTRLWARRRWQEMGRDPAVLYATRARSAANPIMRARAYIGLAETGTAIERQEVLGLVRSADLPLQKVGLSLLKDHAAAEDVPLLFQAVAGDHSRVARLAGEVLAAHLRLWSPTDLAPLKAAEDPALRSRAWWIHRLRGGWEAVIAGLELLHDPDPRVAASGRQSEPPMYLLPTAAQQHRIAELLATVPIGPDRRRSIAFAAGLPDPGQYS
ncbi:hypothetical protein [Lentzea sp.]|uniref:hypothetical protein n=1 Tax=Lentzea sp. TaxID=56099 RepID=UPI002ED07122